MARPNGPGQAGRVGTCDSLEIRSAIGARDVGWGAGGSQEARSGLPPRIGLEYLEDISP